MAQTSGVLSGCRISCLFITVCDFDRMLHFYRDILGFQVTYIEENACAFMALEVGQQPQLAFYPGRPEVARRENHWFIAIDVEDIAATVDRLRSLGAIVEKIVDVPYGRAAKLEDPEGNVIEIHEPGKQLSR